MYEATVVGFKHNTGTYQGTPYDNYNVHVVCDSQDPEFVGQQVMEVKIRSKMNYIPRINDRIILYYGPNGLDRVEVA